MIKLHMNLGHTKLLYAVYDKKIDAIIINTAREEGANLIVII